MDGYGWIWMDMEGYGWIWMDKDGYGWIRMDMDGYGWMDGWMDGWIRMDMDGWMDGWMDGCGNHMYVWTSVLPAAAAAATTAVDLPLGAVWHWQVCCRCVLHVLQVMNMFCMLIAALLLLLPADTPTPLLLYFPLGCCTHTARLLQVEIASAACFGIRVKSPLLVVKYDMCDILLPSPPSGSMAGCPHTCHMSTSHHHHHPDMLHYHRGQWAGVQPDDKDLVKYHAWMQSTGGLGAAFTHDD
jgi:hypothetical protein